MKRLRITAIVLGCALALGLAAVIGTDREPAYQGISLHQWLQRAQTLRFKNQDLHSAGQDSELQACQIAIDQMEPLAIPFLLRDLQKQDSPLRARLAGWSQQAWVANLLPGPGRLWLQQHLTADRADTLQRHRLAVLAFDLLGPKAAEARPALLKLTEDDNADHHFWALSALAGTKPSKEVFMSASTRLLNDPSDRVRLVAAIKIMELYPEEAEALDVYKKFPQLYPLRPPTAPR